MNLFAQRYILHLVIIKKGINDEDFDHGGIYAR